MSVFDFQKWLRVYDYKNIESFLRSEKGKGTAIEATGRVAVSDLVVEIPSALVSLLKAVVAGAGLGAAGVALMGGLGLAGLAFGTVFSVVFVTVLFLLSNGTQHIIAGMLGGKGKFEDLLHLDSLATAAANLASLVSLIPAIFGIMPGSGTLISGGLSCLLLPFWLLLIAYMVYVTYLILKTTYGLDRNRAIGALVLNVVLWAAIAIAIILVLTALLGAALLGLAGSGALLK